MNKRPTKRVESIEITCNLRVYRSPSVYLSTEHADNRYHPSPSCTASGNVLKVYSVMYVERCAGQGWVSGWVGWGRVGWSMCMQLYRSVHRRSGNRLQRVCSSDHAGFTRVPQSYRYYYAGIRALSVAAARCVRSCNGELLLDGPPV